MFNIKATNELYNDMHYIYTLQSITDIATRGRLLWKYKISYDYPETISGQFSVNRVALDKNQCPIPAKKNSVG